MNTIRSLIILLLISIFSYQGFAQRGYSYGRQSIISNIDLNAGWYIPGLDYLNNDSYMAALGGSFDGGIFGTLGADIKMNTFYMGIYAGYFTDNAEVKNITIGGIDRDEKLSLTLLPITFKVKYEIKLGDPRNYRTKSLTVIHPYFGLGATYNLISQKYERSLDGEVDKGTLTGSTGTYMGIAGIKFSITSNFDIGLEYNHILGAFNQVFIVDAEASTHAVSLGGPMGTICLSYSINGRKGGKYKKMKKFR